MEVEKVPCPSKAENGEQCGFELISRFNVCPICKAEVDKSWFQRGAQFSDVHLDKNGNTGTSASSESGNPVTQNDDNQSNISRRTSENGNKEKAETTRKESGNKEIVGRGEEGLKGGGVEKGRENIGNRKRKKGEEDEDNNGGKSKETRKENNKEESELEKENLRKQQETHGGGDGKDGMGGSREETRKENENQGSQGDKNKKEADRKAERIMGTGDLGNGSKRERENKEMGTGDLGNGSNRERENKEMGTGDLGNGSNRERKNELRYEKNPISDPNLRSSAEGATNLGGITIVNKEFPVSKEKEHPDKQNTQSSNKTGEHSDNSNNSQTKKKVKVCFHAFLAPTVDFNQKKDQLFVVFGSERDNWDCRTEGLMEITGLKGKKKQGIPVFAEIELEKDLLKNNGLAYRYCFQRKGGSSNKSHEIEFLFQKFYPYHNNCRILAIPTHLDYYQQFDGFIYVKIGGYIYNLFKDTFGISNSSMIEVMKKDGEHALKQYLPNVCRLMENPNQEPSTIITTVKKYCQVFQGGVKDQFMLYRKQYAPGLWQQFIMEDHLRRAIEALNNHENELDENGRLLKALLMVKLLVDLDINPDFLDLDTVQIIHHSLLLAPGTETSLCPQLEYLKACLVEPSLKKDIRDCLVSFLKVSAKKAEITERNPSWITCLPIIHFLDGSLHPFEGMDYAKFQDKSDDWWIISELKQEKEELKNRKWSRSPSELMNWLKPLFILDTKTQRSFMACIKLEDLEITLSEENILLEIKLATMQYYFEICQYRSQMNVLQKCTDTLCAILQKQLMEFPLGPKREWNEVEERFKIQEEKCMAILSNGMLKRGFMSDKRCLVSLFHSDILTLAMLEAVSKNSLELKTLEQRSIFLIDEILLEVGSNITVFDFALSIMQFVKKNDVIVEWERKCLMHAKKLFETIDIKRRVELYIKSFEESQNESLKSTIQEVVMECISDILQDPSSLTFFQCGERFWLMDENIIFLSKLFSQMWTLSSSAEITDDGIIDRALSSPFFPKCVEAYLLKKEVIQSMDKTAQHNLSRSVSLMESLFKKLLKNEVRIEVLELITSKKETFLAVAQVFEKFNDKSIPLTSSALENIVSCREKDLKRLQEVITTVQKLHFFFREISESSKIRIMEIDERKLQNWRSLEIGKVCAITEESGEFGQYQPDVFLFSDLFSKLDFIVKNIICYNESKTFHKILKNIAQLYRKSTDFQFGDVIDKILIPTTDTWDEICNKMKTGSISVSEIEKYCFNDFTDVQLYNELVAMNRGRKEDWIKDRITQLQRFRMFSKTVSVAKLLLKVRDEYDIDGSFENLELIAKSDTYKEISLVDLKMSIEKFNQKLEKINENQKKSIASFTKAIDLVQWMRSALPGGIKDLKIYADLALLSVEGDEHVGRVTHLHSAAIGYSSVIFGDINGEVEMINTWRVVWQNLEKDESLPKKLEESNRVLNWFIEIKEAHGSVEVTSLKQVDAIKDRGIFKVGNSGKAVKNSHQLDLQDVILLHVPAARFATNDRREVVREDLNSEQSSSEDETEENDRSLTSLKLEKIELEGEGRDYTLGEMTDLQSRLMLVTGKADAGRESIERFTSIFDNVTRLGKVFLQLHASGCILFKHWTFEFHCNQNAGSSVMIRTHEQSVVKGTNFQQHDEDLENAHSNVNEYIRKIADFMESCYEEWIDYIAEKRKVFYPLNLYTVDQMVLLQEEIAKYRNGNQVTQFLCPLLSVVKSHCSLDPDLDDANNKVQENLLALEQTSKMENESEKNTHTDAIREFLQVAEGTGISRKHALRAIQSQEFDVADTDAGLIWCMSNDEKDDEEEYIQDNTSEVNTSAKDTTFGDRLKEFMEELEENLRQQEVAQVILNLDVTWKKFLSCASSSATDFLSIDHLGMILDVLYKGENCILKRTLIDPLKCGKPNLIVCPQSEVIPMVLTIYMADPNLPLPSRNEVLLCTDHTTKEEVDIFFRRALFQSEIDQNERIFCLMNADKLQYDASEQSLKDVTEYIKSASGDYKLVIICSSENEYKSPMISALDKYRAPKIAVAGVGKIKEYLKKKYTPENVSDSAADVDSIGHCVRVVKSEKAGMGKSLHKKRLTEKLQTKNPIGVVEDFPLSVTIPLSQKQIDVVEVSSRILKCTLPNDISYPRIFHIDIAYGVERYVGAMLFNMLILGSLIDESGYIFHRSETDLYIVETTLPNDKDQESEFESSVQLMNILPSVRCISPEEVLKDDNDSRNDEHVVGFDEKNFQSDEYQRPYHYLMHYENRVGDIPVFNRNIKETDKKKCLQVLIRHCCVENPSWAELRNFIHFLNTQLQDFEKSVYCSAILQQDLPGFPVFVLRFLIQMSKDFSTRSLDISEGRTDADIRIAAENDDESSVSMEDESHYSETDEDIKQFQMRRKWETSAHPYLFFNPDQHTITFIGFNIDKYSRNLVDQQTRMVLERNIMSKQLWDALRANNVPLQENFDDLSREQKIERLCRVVGNDLPQDPDETYELTTDNVKKMMAIYMRFRCNIPVIVMGETGCGKTCLIKFLCSLQCPAGVPMNTMILMKVHGGTTKKHIIEKVKQAESLAELNCREHGKHIITVLFFDEANTTEAVGCIKEIMCDGTIDGQALALNTNLKLVAACNPYRKHSDEMIDRLERAGLGYHVNSDETDDKLGRIPMRHLVYRVQPLPQSMLPLVWDFGQLDNNVEKLYIIQMVQRCVRNGTLPPINRRIISILSDILAASQEFMRNQRDECSFVSLRDVERTLKVFGWMYNQTEIFDAMDEVELEEQDDDEEMVQPAASRYQDAKMTKALLLALGVCYHSSLKSREEYREYITEYFAPPFELSRGAEEMKREITRCQMAFLQNLRLNDNIAKNLALRENFFMMVVCVELRIPLFLVGKPGSSKSLSKTILDHNMQGRDSDSPLFKSLKQVQLISFQCSPLATADGILKTFNQASSFQKSKDLEKFVSVVVLDEVGLAEDSPRMPLKALHPLLEDGCPDDEEFEEHKKVSFIGISNWALDPAKMNRGILVQREVPDEQDLIESARGICEHDDVYLLIEDLIPKLAQAYLHVFNKACNSDTLFRHIDDVPSENLLKAREFFGLRDFYSLVKMICAVAVENRRSPTSQEIIIAIKRNFGGLEGLDPVQEFGEFLPFILQERQENRGVKTDTALLRECLQYEENKKESRYILLLTEHYGALNLLHQLMGNEENTHVIFGSSFPRDQEYIEICRNINRIKVFMETGKTVVLLNLENLYESLYDALNQYYMESGPDRYIDLGLGTHRVKCKVDKKFRLVVVAEKRVVYREFPIPLINRMEKHFLTVEGMLTDVQLRLSHRLEQWAREFSSVADSETIRIEEVFIGYNKDTAAGVVLKAWEICSKNSMEENDSLQHRVLEAAKDILLWGCTPDAVLRLNKTEQEIFAKQYRQIYFKDQCHESLCDFLQFRNRHDGFGGNFIQITTHSKLMSETDKQGIERKLPFLSGKFSLLSLQAFDTEQQFSNQIREISQKGKELLLIQCDTGDENSSLVECARHCVQRELQTNELKLCVVFLVHLSRVSKSFFSGFQTGLWTSVHIDELRLTSLPCIQDLMTKSISAILQDSLCSEENFSEEAEYESAMVTNLQERHVNLRTILFNCIHPALASITEVDDNQERSIKRIKFIFKELNKSKQLTEGRFGYCLMKHIVTILSKHSADSILYNESWIQSEAAMSSSVNKTGTLRASCQRIIEDRVTPLLAKIVAFVDTNNNLSILENSDCEVQWLTDLWLGIFSSIDVENLIKIKVPQVMNTCANHLASASFPFSWLIYEAVEQFLLVTSENAIEKSAEELFQETEIGHFVLQHLAIENLKEATRLYMSDFVKISHKASCSREEMIVCEFLNVCFEEYMAGKEDNFTIRVFCIHKTFRNIKPKLEIFSAVMCFVPQGDGSFYQKVESDIKELDITAVKYLLEVMEPNETSIDTPDGQDQWIKNVQRYRPVIERLLHADFDKTSARGRLMLAIRSRWTKIVVLKLFIQNLCINTTREKLMAQTCKILWKITGDNSNFKEKSSLEKLEKFLKASNLKAMTEFLGKFGKCANCDKLFDSSPPVLLPCGHRICREECFSIIVQTTEAEKLCPVNKCSQSIPENFDENETPENQKEQMKLFNDYQERCNKFYMQIVSQLCFENATPPSDEVMRHLLQLIIHKKTIPQLNMTIIRTRQMTIFETVVDTTPVFRSFLLQLLIRTSEEAVFPHLEEFLRETDTVLQVQNKSHELELCRLLMQCFEDSLVEQAANLNQDREKEATFVKELLSTAIENLENCSAVIEKLRNVATARYCLQTTAKYLKECYSVKPESNGSVYEEIFRMTAMLCDLPINHIRIYLLTHICRSYGLDLYQLLLKSNEQWLFPTEGRVNEVMQECPDYCVVLGNTYREIRDDIAKLLLVKNKRLSLKITERSGSVQIFYLLALIKEIKVRELFSDVEPLPKQFVEALKNEFARKNLQTVQQYLDNVLEDSFAHFCKQLQIQYHRDIRGQGIVILLLHFLLVLKSLPSNELLQPLVRLATNPISLKDSFLPTMPEEVLSGEIKTELQRMEEIANKVHHTVTWYRCPNGHPYAVGDCGNPTQVGRCYHCKAQIGGESRIRDDNAKDTGADFSQPGHILGSAEGRSTQAISERTLSPSSNILLRLLMHMAMLIGANEHSDDVYQLIQPAIPTFTVSDFLWAHLSKDIDTLQVSLDRSLDDILMFLHSTIHSFLEGDTSYAGITRRVTVLNQYDWFSKEGRSAWETAIDRKFLSRLLQERRELFEKCEEILSNDRSMGSDPILRAVFRKVADSASGFSTSSLQSSPHVWQHRTKVTFEHFVQEFYVMKNNGVFRNPYFVLEKFLQQECHLRHLRHIPNILQMLRILITKYGKQITRDEAETMTLHDCVNQFRNDPAQKIVAAGFTSFCELWNALRHMLISFYDANDEMKSFLGRDINKESTNIRTVLPDVRGVGACSRILLEFLIGKQNEFVTACGQSIDPRFSIENAVTMKNVTAMHLISFNREADIFPVILANCSYTYMQEENTKLEYDFENIQAVLQDRFLFGKPLIDSSKEFPLMSFKADTSVSMKFNTLVIKIPQEALNKAVQSQIAEEFADLPELYVTIGNIDVVVNFLLSVHSSGEVLLNSFMVETLQMKPLPSSKASQCCKLSHVQSLWFLLFHEKTKRLHYSEKEAFDSMNSSIQESLPENCVLELDSYLNELSLEKLEILLEQLMECIIFSLNCGEGDIVSFQYSLNESLMVHLENGPYPDVDLKTFKREDVEKIPASILTVHAVEVWKKIHRTVRSRK